MDALPTAETFPDLPPVVADFRGWANDGHGILSNLFSITDTDDNGDPCERHGVRIGDAWGPDEESFRASLAHELAEAEGWVVFAVPSWEMVLSIPTMIRDGVRVA